MSDLQGNNMVEGEHRLVDDRKAARGLGRLVVALFWAAGGATFVVAVWQLFSDHTDPIGPKLTTLFAGVIYLAAALGITHNGRRMRGVAWSAMSIALAGPIIVGLSGLGGGQVGGLWSPWAQFGRETWFVSLVLPLVGIGWLWWSNPKRIVEIAEGIERIEREARRHARGQRD